MSRRARKLIPKPKLYRSDDLVEILAEEIPQAERVLMEVLSLLARRKVIVNAATDLGGMNRSGGELTAAFEEAEVYEPPTAADVLERLEQLSRRVEQVAELARTSGWTDYEEKLARQRDRREAEGQRMMWDPEKFLSNPLDMIAALICETYSEAGEDAALADDEALQMIRDLLLQVDEEIIERWPREECCGNRKKVDDGLVPESCRPIITLCE